MFYLVTLVYPRCAQTCLQLFSVTKLDVGSFLSADFTILVRDTVGHWGRVYVRYLAPGIALLLVFAIGLPIWYFYIMWTVRHRLRVRPSAQAIPCEQSLGSKGAGHVPDSAWGHGIVSARIARSVLKTSLLGCPSASPASCGPSGIGCG